MSINQYNHDHDENCDCQEQINAFYDRLFDADFRNKFTHADPDFETLLSKFNLEQLNSLLYTSGCIDVDAYANTCQALKVEVF